MDSQAQSGLFLLEAFELIGGTTILGVLYGTAFVLYCLCARLSYLQLQEPDKWWQARFTLAYISLIIFCTTTLLVLSAHVFKSAFINYANSPAGPLEYQSSMSAAVGIIDLIIEVLIMVIQIWHLWIVWSGTQYAVAVTTLPSLLLFAYIGLVISISIETGFWTHKRLGISTERFSVIATATYTVLSIFTVLVTGLVITCLLLARRRHVRILGTSDTSSPYMSIVAILVESYALDSMWSIGAAISVGVSSPSMFLFIENDSTIKVITYFLVVYRVATGRGWTKETERKQTSLQWNCGVQTVADKASSIRSSGPATTTVVVIGSPSISHVGSVV